MYRILKPNIIYYSILIYIKYRIETLYNILHIIYYILQILHEYLINIIKFKIETYSI